MQICVLGTAAGGGIPQWNCACSFCCDARDSYGEAIPDAGRYAQPSAVARFHASLAVSGTGENWYLINATPDIRFQIESASALHPGPDIRNTPIRGVLLTDCELDHTIGLLVMREGTNLEIYGSRPVLESLSAEFPARVMLDSYTHSTWQEIEPDVAFFLDSESLLVECFFAGDKPPRYSRNRDRSPNQPWVVGYRLKDQRTGGSIAVIPQLSAFSERICDILSDVDMAFIDGTCFYDDDLSRRGISRFNGSVTGSREMGHLPLFSEDGDGIVNGINAVNSKRKDADKSPLRSILFHINNTNPILCDKSDEYEYVIANGVEIGKDGYVYEI